MLDKHYILKKERAIAAQKGVNIVVSKHNNDTYGNRYTHICSGCNYGVKRGIDAGVYLDLDKNSCDICDQLDLIKIMNLFVN